MECGHELQYKMEIYVRLSDEMRLTLMIQNLELVCTVFAVISRVILVSSFHCKCLNKCMKRVDFKVTNLSLRPVQALLSHNFVKCISFVAIVLISH